jgi:hypothetical protein
LSDEEVLDIFEHQAEQLRTRLERYAQIPQESASYLETGSPREVFFWMLTLECGIRATQAHLEWVESVIQRLRNKEHPSVEE